MPRYYFDIDDSVSITDRVGQDLADLDAVKAEAYRCAAEYGSDPANLSNSGAIIVTVRNEQNDIVLHVRLVCAIEEF